MAFNKIDGTYRWQTSLSLNFLMGIVQKDAVRTMILSYGGIVLGYLNKVFLFIVLFTTEQIGLLNLLHYIGALFAQFANFGTLYTTWKFFPFFRNREKNHHGFFSLMLLIVLLGISVCISVLLIFRKQIEAAYVKESPQFVEYYIWVIPIGIAVVMFLLFEIYIRSLYKNIVGVFANEVLFRLATAAILLIYWAKWISFPTFVIAYSFSYFVPVIIVAIYLWRIGELNIVSTPIAISKRFRGIILRYSSYFYINTLGLVLISSLDVIMLAQMRGLKETGIYSMMLFFIGAFQIPYKSIVRVGVSLVSEHWKHRNMEAMQKLYAQVSSVSLTVGTGLFLLAWLNIDFLLTFLKPEFSAGKWVLFYLMVGKLFDMYCGINGSILSTSKKYKYDLIFTILLIALVYAMNLLLIPVLGMNGAAISTSGAIILVNIIRLIYVQFAFGLTPYKWSQLGIATIGAAALMAGTLLHVFENSWLQAFFECVLIGVVFLLPIYFFNLDPEIVNFIKRFIEKRRKKSRI